MQPTGEPLKLLLFIDRRPSSAEQVRQICHHFEQLEKTVPLSLDIIDVGEQPYLAEHFKLVATPVLIKLSESGQQTLAGSDIVSQMEYWWPRWQQEIAHSQTNNSSSNGHGQPSEHRDSFSSVAQSTEIIRLADEIFCLNQTKAELEAQLLFKNRIIAMLAHDLRNPLTAASIAIETLELGYDPESQRLAQFKPELTAQLLRNAKGQIRAIDRMITDILQTAHGPSSEIQIYPQEFDFKHLCYEVFESMERNVKGKQQTLSVDIPQDLPAVYADANQVKRVIVNLLDNAIKYTPKGGKISIVALHRTTQKMQCSIQDTGPGIPEENQAHIFEESFRLTRDRNEDGYGLGLALCLRIVRAHYGQIWVDSIAGEGSTFHFTLPVYKAYSQALEPFAKRVSESL